VFKAVLVPLLLPSSIYPHFFPHYARLVELVFFGRKRGDCGGETWIILHRFCLAHLLHHHRTRPAGCRSRSGAVLHGAGPVPGTSVPIHALLVVSHRGGTPGVGAGEVGAGVVLLAGVNKGEDAGCSAGALAIFTFNGERVINVPNHPGYVESVVVFPLSCLVWADRVLFRHDSSVAVTSQFLCAEQPSKVLLEVEILRTTNLDIN